MDKLLKSVSGQAHGAALGASLPYREAQRNLRTERDPDLELAGTWSGTVPPGRIHSQTQCNVTQRLCKTVSPTHSPVQGLRLAPTASCEDRWSKHAGHWSMHLLHHSRALGSYWALRAGTTVAV